MGGAYKVKKLAARDSHFLLNNFLIENFGVAIIAKIAHIIAIIDKIAIIATASMWQQEPHEDSIIRRS